MFPKNLLPVLKKSIASFNNEHIQFCFTYFLLCLDIYFTLNCAEANLSQLTIYSVDIYIHIYNMYIYVLYRLFLSVIP